MSTRKNIGKPTILWDERTIDVDDFGPLSLGLREHFTSHYMIPFHFVVFLSDILVYNTQEMLS